MSGIISLRQPHPNNLNSRCRETSNVQITTLQGVRGASALMVVFYHATPMVKSMPLFFHYAFGWGYCGVDFFFVLSGFILLYVHFDQVGHPEKLKKYFVKRFSRIFPAYWAVLAFVVPTCLVVSSSVSPEKKHIGYVAASFFLLPQWDPFLGVAWSLSCEVFFYLVFALLILNRKSFGAAVILWVVLIAINLLHPLPFPLDFLCQPRVAEFLVGMCIAWGIHRGFRFTPRRSLTQIAAGVGICLIAGCTQIARGNGGNVFLLCFGLAAVLIISSLVSLELDGFISAGRGWLLLGDASYSIYLVHYPILLVMLRLLPNHPPLNINWLLAIIAAVLGGIAFHLLIEKRVCKLARRSLESRPSGRQGRPLSSLSTGVIPPLEQN
jgi:exopolysaccharide production protein ExoZ